MKLVSNLIMNPVLVLAALLAIGLTSHASTFQCEGKEVTKGEAIKALIANPKAKCLKLDQIVFDEVKGTVRNAPKN